MVIIERDSKGRIIPQYNRFILIKKVCVICKNCFKVEIKSSLKKLGYNVIRIWESDIKSNIDFAINPLLNLIRNNKMGLKEYS